MAKENGSAKKQTVIGFYKQEDPYGEFSNFWLHEPPFEFVVPEFAQCAGGPKSFPCTFSEKAIMVIKACVFKDVESAQKIVKTDTAMGCKELGRAVANFDQAKWNSVVEDIAYEVCRQKFLADAHCKKVLLGTGDQVLAEASARDAIWGIGLPVGDEKVQDQSQWQGTNFLGTALMKVRNYLRLVKKPKWHKVAKIRPEAKGLNLMLKCVSCSKVDGATDTWEAVCGDDTGVVTFSLRNKDHADLCQPGASLRVQNARVVMVRNFIRVTVDKWGVMKAAADKDCDFTAKTDKDVSATEYERA